jgi:hypothetical protein
MYIYIELWKATARWWQLARAEREQYMQQVRQGIESLRHTDVEVLGWGVNDRESAHPAEYDFFALWKVGDPQELHII